MHSVTLNGRELDPAEVSDGIRIQLPDLAADNELTVVADAPYMNTGEGLHRFVDPVDGEVYLYTQFEVPDSRRMFAVFEQPDLKATFAFTVTAPSHWDVISNSPTPAPVETSPGTTAAPARSGTFAPTPRLSSYVTALIAGPYQSVRSEVTSSDGRVIPLGVFARKSLMQYLDADNIFELTRQGFEFFEAQFGCPYPFEKYDQLFVPEFNAGAMENAGAVTILEGYVFRGKVTGAQVERRAITVLHELAHMWFGDLVTMRWWNDLWLNESFAEYMSHLAAVENTKFHQRLDHVRLGGEVVGLPPGPAPHHPPDLRRDQRPAGRGGQLRRHHLRQGRLRAAPAGGLGGAGAVHGRRPRILRQACLAEHRARRPDGGAGEGQRTRPGPVGPALAGNRRGEHAHSRNSTVDADGTITVLRHPAVSRCRAAHHPPAPARRGFLRRHSDGKLERVHREELDVDGERTEVPALAGLRQPDLILLNDDDLAYAKVRLDEKSLATATAHLKDFRESLPRTLVWGSAWDAARDGETPARGYVDLILANIASESRLLGDPGAAAPAGHHADLLRGRGTP